MIELALTAALPGIGVGLILGITGAGGAVLAVPALVLLLGLPISQAAPIALIAVGISAAVGALIGLKQGILRYKAAGTLAIGAGSMVGWHVNNSGFWIFTSLYGFDTKQGLKYFTTTNALGGIVAFIVLVIIHAVGLV